MQLRRSTILALAVFALAAGAAPAQAPLPGTTGQSHAADLVMARKLAMNRAGQRVETLTFMIQPGAEFHADIAAEATQTVADLMRIVPHLFAPQTNTMPDRADPQDFAATNARPEVWAEFDDFYARAQATASLAEAAGRAAGSDGFGAAVTALQQACDGCHRDYRRTRSTYAIPIPLAAGN